MSSQGASGGSPSEKPTAFCRVSLRTFEAASKTAFHQLPAHDARRSESSTSQRIALPRHEAADDLLAVPDQHLAQSGARPAARSTSADRARPVTSRFRPAPRRVERRPTCSTSSSAPARRRAREPVLERSTSRLRPGERSCACSSKSLLGGEQDAGSSSSHKRVELVMLELHRRRREQKHRPARGFGSRDPSRRRDGRDSSVSSCSPDRRARAWCASSTITMSHGDSAISRRRIFRPRGPGM